MSPVQLEERIEETSDTDIQINARVTFGTFVIRVPFPENGESNDNSSS